MGARRVTTVGQLIDENLALAVRWSSIAAAHEQAGRRALSAHARACSDQALQAAADWRRWAIDSAVRRSGHIDPGVPSRLPLLAAFPKLAADYVQKVRENYRAVLQEPFVTYDLRAAPEI